jgi:hypothetical protein
MVERTARTYYLESYPRRGNLAAFVRETSAFRFQTLITCKVDFVLTVFI